jgi:transglutaminase-like putative cysteine protease
MILNVNHLTRFDYTQPVTVSQQLLRLTPRECPGQTVLDAAISILPSPSFQSDRRDYFGNVITQLAVQSAHTTLTVQAQSRVRVDRVEERYLDLSTCWEEVGSTLAQPSSAQALEASPFVYASPYVAFDDAVRSFAAASFAPGKPFLPAVAELTGRIFHEFQYEGDVTDVWTPVSSVLAQKRGVCQDFAHLEIACLRSLGLAARYVSGYLLTRPPDGVERLVGADASHAWVSVWSPEFGWVDFDPTNNLVPSGEHVTLAWGRDYGDVSPINGFIVGGGEHTV